MIAQGFEISSKFTFRGLAVILVRPVVHSRLVPSASRERAKGNTCTGMQVILLSFNRAHIFSFIGTVQSSMAGRARIARATGGQVRTLNS